VTDGSHCCRTSRRTLREQQERTVELAESMEEGQHGPVENMGEGQHGPVESKVEGQHELVENMEEGQHGPVESKEEERFSQEAVRKTGADSLERRS